MNSMADIMVKAGVVTEDQATVAKNLQADIRKVESELRLLRNPRRITQLSPEDRERIRVLDSRLRILKRTKVVE